MGLLVNYIRIKLRWENRWVMQIKETLPFVILAGDKEIENQSYTLKSM